MPATKERFAEPTTERLSPSSAMDVTAARIFSALESLHGISATEAELIGRSAAGLRYACAPPRWRR